MFIKIALDDLHPATLVALRLTVGMLTLLIVTRWRKLSLPRQWAIWQQRARESAILVGCLGYP